MMTTTYLLLPLEGLAYESHHPIGEIRFTPRIGDGSQSRYGNDYIRISCDGFPRNLKVYMFGQRGKYWILKASECQMWKPDVARKIWDALIGAGWRVQS
jgi:hypothetical protein